MKTNAKTSLLLLSLTFVVVACSKTETNDMMFRKVVSNATSVSESPVPGESSSNIPDPAVVMEDPQQAPVADPAVVVVTNTNNNTNNTTSTTTTTNNNTTTVSDNSTTTNTTTTNTTATTTTTTTSTNTTNTNTTTDTTKTTSEYVPYKESEIPSCKIDITVAGLGSATRVAIASASKEDLKSKSMKGFEYLSTVELKAMRDSVDSMKSSSQVQVIAGSDSFDASRFKKGQMVMVVVDGKEKKSIDIGGLGKDAQIMVMVASEGHNTVCVKVKGNSKMDELAVTVLGDSTHVARGSIDTNSNGSAEAYLKVVGSNQTGSKYEGNAVKDTKITLITEGKNDTFSSLIASGGIDNCEMNVKIKGMNDTGWGMKGNFLTQSKMNLEIEGNDNVETLMDVKGKIQGNDFGGWVKAKSGAKLDPIVADLIELMSVS